MIPQGLSATGEAYFAAMTSRVNSIDSCTDLQAMSTEVNASVNATLAAIEASIINVEQQIMDLTASITDISTTAATLALAASTHTVVGALGATATAAVNDLGTAIAYIKTQGIALFNLGTANSASLTKAAISLGAEITKFTHDVQAVEKKLETLQAQVVAIPIALAQLNSTIANAALTFPSCSIL